MTTINKEKYTGGQLMKGAIVNYRKRTGATQQDVANMFHTDKSNISHIDKERSNVTASMYDASFNNVSDAHLLHDMRYSVAYGCVTPTPSDRVYDDHCMSFVHRVQQEIEQFINVIPMNRLDKRPEFLPPDEKERMSLLVSELQDVIS